MLENIAALGVIILLTLLFAWLTRRAWRSPLAIFRLAGGIVAGLLTVLLALVSVLDAIGLYRLYAPRNAPRPNIAVAGTPEQAARGEHLASIICASCHSPNGELPLSGGNNLSADTGLPLGAIYVPNITSAALSDLSEADLWRAIRYGVDRTGRPLLMPASDLSHLSDEDLTAIIAYLRQSPPVQTEVPDTNPSILFALLVGAGLVNLDTPQVPGPVTAPPKAATAEYGQYIVSYFGCGGCHGPQLDGNAPPPAPPAPNLRVIMPKWSKEDFFKAMRTGIDPTGHPIQPPMPWQAIGRLDDVELEALYKYLNGLATS